MTFCFVGIGSNKNPEYHCKAMIAALRARFGKVWVSDLKQSEAYGIEAADYINGVVCFEADLTPPELKQWCRTLEDSFGRIRGGNTCVADLDILYMGERLTSLSHLPAVEHFYQVGLNQVFSQYDPP